MKSQNLIEINTPGMTVTKDGQNVLEGLEDFIHQIKGLNDIEKSIKSVLGLKDVVIVPGNVEDNPSTLKELGKAAANCVKNIIKDSDIIAITGGSTIKEVVEAFPKVNNVSEVLVIPARGGMGRKVESQANYLAAALANKVDGTYKVITYSRKC